MTESNYGKITDYEYNSQRQRGVLTVDVVGLGEKQCVVSGVPHLTRLYETFDVWHQHEFINRSVVVEIDLDDGSIVEIAPRGPARHRHTFDELGRMHRERKSAMAANPD